MKHKKLDVLDMSKEYLIENLLRKQKSKDRGNKLLESKFDLLSITKKRKLRWYGLVTRSNCLAKTILDGTIQGIRK